MGNLFLITGNDDFAVKSKAKDIAVHLCGENPEENPELEIIRGDSDDMKPEAILTDFYNSLNTPPFLCSSKKIWLKNFQHFEKILAVAGKKRFEKQNRRYYGISERRHSRRYRYHY